MPRMNPFRDFRYPVSVHFGKELPSTATVQEVQQAVCDVSTQTFEMMKKGRHSLAVEFIRSARRHFDKVAIFEDRESTLTYGQLLVLADRTRRKIAGQLDADEKRIGLLVNNQVDHVILNIALSLNGLVPVSLSADESEASLSDKCMDADIQALIVEGNIKTTFPAAKTLSSRDLIGSRNPSPGFHERMRAKWAPEASLGHADGFDPDDTATIQFTRGTTGKPKAVQLSHHNILSNIEALKEVVCPEETDTFLGIVPIANIYGYTISIWLPLLSGAHVTYSSTVDYQRMSIFADKHAISILPATPELLKWCIDSIPTEAFRNLRFVFTGGAPLDIATADRFEKKFGIRPLEGYGATELSPVCSLSLPDMKVGIYREKGTREKSVGRLLQGIAVKIVDPDTNAPKPAGETGLIIVKGPNVMTGYYNNHELTQQAIHDGWYRTGDLGMLDNDGFLTVAGRCDA